MSPMNDELAALVGGRIRRLRLDSGLGLREAAGQIGIAPSALSALENHRGGMSISRLQLVAGHFGLSLTDLLQAEEGEEADGAGRKPEVFRRAMVSTDAVDDETYRLEQGDAIRFRTERGYAYRNPSDQSMALALVALCRPW